MKRTHFAVTLLCLLFLCAVAQAQERGDGIATPGTSDPNGIVTGRTGAYNNGSGIKRGANAWFNKNMMSDNDNVRTGKTLPFTPGSFEFGVKIGGSFQQMQHSPFTTSFNPGIVGGLYFRRYWRITAIKIELLGSSAHYVSARPAGYYDNTRPIDSVTKSNFTSLYLSLPVLAQLRIFHHIYLEIGPEYSYLLSYADKNGAFTKIYGQSDIFKTSDFSGVIGVEARISPRFKADVRYAKGLTDVNKSIYPQSYSQWNINSIQATASYRLFRSTKK